jgi:hypothetical protein
MIWRSSGALQDFVSKAGGSGGGSGLRGGAASTIDDDLELMRKKVELMELRKREAQLLEEMPKRPGDVPATFADLLTCLHAGSDKLKTNALLIPDFADKKMGKKPTIETVSVGQWVMGNARIMLRLLDDDRLVKRSGSGSVDTSELRSYLAFNVHIGELLEAEHDWRAVVSYDNDMRIQQQAHNRQWDVTDLSLIVKHITAPRFSKKRSSSKSQKTRGGQTICGLFNCEKSCTRSVCKFAHVCRICEGDHPAHQHREAKN